MDTSRYLPTLLFHLILRGVALGALWRPCGFQTSIIQISRSYKLCVRSGWSLRFLGPLGAFLHSLSYASHPSERFIDPNQRQLHCRCRANRCVHVCAMLTIFWHPLPVFYVAQTPQIAILRHDALGSYSSDLRNSLPLLLRLPPWRHRSPHRGFGNYCGIYHPLTYSVFGRSRFQNCASSNLNLERYWKRNWRRRFF